MATIVLETVIRAPREACFDLSLSVDAHAASMGKSGERAVAGITTGLMSLGDTVTWQARHFGLRFRLTSAITAYERPLRFVDEQVRGPFRFWHHEHVYQALPDGATRMRDNIRFASPAGPIGRLVDVVVLTAYLRRLIEQRNDHLRAVLEERST